MTLQLADNNKVSYLSTVVVTYHSEVGQNTR